MKRPQWQMEGREPDYRFSLANERTFLAWIRTALAVLAGGVLLEQFSGHLANPTAAKGVATVLIGVAALIAGFAYARWKSMESAMRHDAPLPSSPAIPAISVGLALAALATAVFFLAS
ncbi:DUF202 domain-containing protein [Hydrogenophaga sp.]|uniref:YidH family protein n=1 Tax=Hydrogenophaga sp. TaxID=1904254 RepID=UPI002BFE0627|nr:DUF202 domain-containing protein [Hydrogenophaga sp.]HMP09487.1 DUF202 domain-containing protein [Hydrogenophaga sp.]